MFPLPAGHEQPKTDGDENEEEDRERDLGVERQARCADDVSDGFHGTLPTAAVDGVKRLMSVPSRCRYAVSATISLRSRSAGPPCCAIPAAMVLACDSAIRRATPCFTASPYGTPSIAMASTRR